MKKKNVAVMYLISFFQGMVFYASISTLYRVNRGLTLSQYALIDSLTFIMTLLMEVPWGIIADRIGYKKTLLIANGFYALSKLIFLNAWGFWGFTLERVFFALAVSGISGVDNSILYLSCDAEQSQKVFSRYSAFGNGGMLISAGLFALLSLSHQQAALYTLIAYGISLALSFLLSEVRDVKQTEEKEDFRALVTETLKDGKLMLFLAGNALISIATWIIIVFINQSQYLACGGDESFIGYTFVIAGLLNFLGIYSAQVTAKLGDRRGGSLLILGMALCAVVLAVTSNLYLSAVMIILTDVLHTLYVPLESRLESDYVKVSDRATMLSIYMMIMDLVSVIPNVTMGTIAEGSLPAAFAGCAVMLVVATVCFRQFVKTQR
ncbi:MAG: MFS transporter [Erysipelotrichaceae bacterium]|nr:MFS transporter [Erysipelotrichaceae bacterium]